MCFLIENTSNLDSFRENDKEMAMDEIILCQLNQVNFLDKHLGFVSNEQFEHLHFHHLLHTMIGMDFRQLDEVVEVLHDQERMMHHLNDNHLEHATKTSREMKKKHRSIYTQRTKFDSILTLKL